MDETKDEMDLDRIRSDTHSSDNDVQMLRWMLAGLQQTCSDHCKKPECEDDCQRCAELVKNAQKIAALRKKMYLVK